MIELAGGIFFGVVALWVAWGLGWVLLAGACSLGSGRQPRHVIISQHPKVRKDMGPPELRVPVPLDHVPPTDTRWRWWAAHDPRVCRECLGKGHPPRPVGTGQMGSGRPV